MGEGYDNGFEASADGVFELLCNLHPFSLRGIMEVVYDQNQIVFLVIFNDLILGKREGFFFGIFIAGARNLLFGCKLALVCKPGFDRDQFPEIRILIKVCSGNFHNMFKANDLFA